MFSSTLILVQGNPKNRENVDRAWAAGFSCLYEPTGKRENVGVICLIQR